MLDYLLYLLVAIVISNGSYDKNHIDNTTVTNVAVSDNVISSNVAVSSNTVEEFKTNLEPVDFQLLLSNGDYADLYLNSSKLNIPCSVSDLDLWYYDIYDNKPGNRSNDMYIDTKDTISGKSTLYCRFLVDSTDINSSVYLTLYNPSLKTKSVLDSSIQVVGYSINCDNPSDFQIGNYLFNNTNIDEVKSNITCSENGHANGDIVNLLDSSHVTQYRYCDSEEPTSRFMITYDKDSGSVQSYSYNLLTY